MSSTDHTPTRVPPRDPPDGCLTAQQFVSRGCNISHLEEWFVDIATYQESMTAHLRQYFVSNTKLSEDTIKTIVVTDIESIYALFTAVLDKDLVKIQKALTTRGFSDVAASLIKQNSISDLSKNDFKESPAWVKTSFSQIYVDEVSLVDRLLNSLNAAASKWSNLSYMSPYTSIIQSSGYGKSRAIKQIAQRTFVVYCCLRPVGSSGFPFRSAIASTLLIDGYNGRNGPTYFYFVRRFVAFIVACMRKLTAFVKEHCHNGTAMDIVPGDPEGQVEDPEVSTIYGRWFDLQIEDTAHEGTADICGVKFWGEIAAEMEKITADCSYIDYEHMISDFNQLTIGAMKEMRAAFSESGLKFGNASLICVMDEARALLVKENTPSAESTLFHYLRIAQSIVPDFVSQEAGYFSVMLDTAAKLSNFQSHIPYDPSARFIISHNMFPPIYLLDTFDTLAQKSDEDVERLIQRIRSFMRTPKPETLSNIEIQIFRYGRALWSSTLTAILSNHKNSANSIELSQAVSNLLHLAATKVCRGTEWSKLTIGDMTKMQAVAIVQPRINMYVTPQAEMAGDMVGDFMGTLLYVPSERRLLFMAYPSEPALAAGSAVITCNLPADDLAVIVDHITAIVREGICGADTKGELITKLLLIYSWDRACQLASPERYPMSVTRPMLVSDFLYSFLDQKLLEEALVGQISPGKKAQFMNSIVFFNHLNSPTYSVTEDDLEKHFSRCAAIVLPRGAAVFDFLIPVLLDDEAPESVSSVSRKTLSAAKKMEATVGERESNGRSRFTFIAIQSRLYSGADPKYKYASSISTPEQSGLSDCFSFPYLVVYMSMGYANGKVKNLKYDNADNTTPSIAKPSKRKSEKFEEQLRSRLANQMIVGAMGLQPCVYPLLRGSNVEAKKWKPSETTRLSDSFRKLSRSWSDPVAIASPEDRKHIERMMPLTYRDRNVAEPLIE